MENQKKDKDKKIQKESKAETTINSRTIPMEDIKDLKTATVNAKPPVKKETLEERRAKENSTKETIEEKRARQQMEKKNGIQPSRKPHKQQDEVHPLSMTSILKDSRTYFMLVLFLPMAYLLYEVIKFDIVPMKYLLPILMVLALISLLFIWLQYSHKMKRTNKLLGKVMMVLMSIALGFGGVYLKQADTAIDEVTVKAGDIEYDVVSVVVKKEKQAETLADIKDGVFAVPETQDPENTKETLADINQQLDKTVQTSPYANTNEQAKALMEDKADAMVLNEAYRSLLEENFPTFEADTKIIYTHKIGTEVEEIGEEVDVLNKAFNVYISGIDTYGPIATNSRSDVNMIATVNPSTKQVLLTSIPRDYYVAQTCQSNQKDKLTHSGIFGVGCTVSSIQNFTGLTLHYYVRVNFSSLEQIVDAIGGVDIYNQFAFYSGVDGALIPGGNIHVNGNTALKFARERNAYADGDRQRGRNQMIVLEGIIQKATSPAIITGYSGIMEAVGTSFQTNMGKSDMTSLIKNQLENGGSWNIQQQSFTGSGGTDWTPANGFNAYVMYPDQASVDTALANVNAILNGETITLE